MVRQFSKARWFVLGALCVSMLARPSLSQTTPATSPSWGKEEAGVRVSLATGATVVAGGNVQVVVTAENNGAEPAATKDAFIWLLIAQGKDKAYLTARIKMTDAKEGAGALGDSLAAGKSAVLTFELGTAEAFAYAAEAKIKDGYPELKDPAVGKLADVISPGKAKAKVMLFLPGKPLVSSAALELAIGEPELAKLTGAAREKYLADLLAGFSKDEFAAKNAHDRAVKAGKELTPELIKALQTRNVLPPYGRMWVTATLCDLGDVRASAVLIAVLKSGDSSAAVVAYHGWKMQDKPLHDAIDAAAAKTPLLAAWAARGSQEFAKTRRPELIGAVIAALDKADDKTKAALVESLEKTTGQKFGADIEKWKSWWAAQAKP